MVLFVLFLQNLKDLDLVIDVEMSVGFIEKKNLRLLAQSTSNQHPLPFATGYGGDELVGKMINIGKPHHLPRNVQILLILESRPADVR